MIYYWHKWPYSIETSTKTFTFDRSYLKVPETHKSRQFCYGSTYPELIDNFNKRRAADFLKLVKASDGVGPVKQAYHSDDLYHAEISRDSLTIYNNGTAKIYDIRDVDMTAINAYLEEHSHDYFKCRTNVWMKTAVLSEPVICYKIVETDAQHSLLEVRYAKPGEKCYVHLGTLRTFGQIRKLQELVKKPIPEIYEFIVLQRKEKVIAIQSAENHLNELRTLFHMIKSL